jgi:prepilin-type N-terminal cleavage/methylation domain-containing protein
MLRKLHIRNKKGFTLTELAIVLGVIGSILGAIWTAAGRANDSNKTQKAVSETLSIVTGYRTLYAQHPVDVADGTDITCMGVNAGFYPADMLAAGVACTTTTYGSYPSTPWGNAASGMYVMMYGYRSWQGVMIQFTTLSQAACNGLANNIANGPDVLYSNIEGHTYGTFGGTYVGPSSAVVNTDCSLAAGNYIQVMFKAR